MLPFSGAQQTLQIKDIRLDWYSICIYCRLYVCTYLFPVLDPALGRLVRVPALRHPPVVLRQLGLEVVVEAEGGGIVLLLVRLVRGLSGARPSGKRKQKETEKKLRRKQNQNRVRGSTGVACVAKTLVANRRTLAIVVAVLVDKARIL